MKQTIAISFKSVSKKYYLQHERTLKGFIPSILRGEKWASSFWVLKNINLKVDTGESVGFIGTNGSGKSTLLKLIAGVTQPTKGKVTVNGTIGPLIELGAGFHQELTGRENIYLNGAILGLTKRQITERFNEIVAFSELADFIDTPLKRYSSGMYMRLGFSVAVHTNPDIFLIDEILSVGDKGFQEKCIDKLQSFKAQGKTIIVVSHSLGLVQQFCKKVYWIDQGEVKNSGTPEKVIKHYEDFVYGRIEDSYMKQVKKLKGVISNVTFLKQQKPTHIFATDDNFTARIYYNVIDEIEKPIFGVAIYRDDGTHLCGPNTKASDFVIDSILGKGYIDYTIDALPLKDGTYFFTVGLSDWQNRHSFDFKDKAFSFRVKGGKQKTPYGLLELEDRWQLYDKKSR